MAFALKMESQTFNKQSTTEAKSQVSSTKVSVTAEDINKYYTNLKGCFECHVENWGGTKAWASDDSSTNCKGQLEGLKAFTTNLEGWEGSLEQPLIDPGKPCNSRIYTVLNVEGSSCDHQQINNKWMGEDSFNGGDDTNEIEFSARIVEQMIRYWESIDSFTCETEINTHITDDIKLKMPDTQIVNDSLTTPKFNNITYTAGDQRTIDKMTVYHTLLKIFSTEDESNDAELKNILKRNIVDKPFSFGSPCDLYNIDIDNKTEFNDEYTYIKFNTEDHASGDFICYQPSHLQVPHNQVSTAVRAGLMQKSCGKIMFPNLKKTRQLLV